MTRPQDIITIDALLGHLEILLGILEQDLSIWPDSNDGTAIWAARQYLEKTNHLLGRK